MSNDGISNVCHNCDRDASGYGAELGEDRAPNQLIIGWAAILYPFVSSYQSLTGNVQTFIEQSDAHLFEVFRWYKSNTNLMIMDRNCQQGVVGRTYWKCASISEGALPQSNPFGRTSFKESL